MPGSTERFVSGLRLLRTMARDQATSVILDGFLLDLPCHVQACLNTSRQ